MEHITFNYSNISKKNIVITIICILLIIGYFIFLNIINYKCLFHKYLGIWCAGCGGTRMIISFTHLDFYQAFRWNPLLFILLIIGIIYFITGIIVFIKKKVIIVPKFKVWMFIIGLLILYMIIRNIDVFSFLIPTRIS